MRHLNSQHYRNHLTDQMEEQHLHLRVDLYSDLQVTAKHQTIWAEMETSLEVILHNQYHLRGGFLLEVHEVVHLHLEEAYHLQAEGLVRIADLIHETSQVQEVGKGQLQVLYIRDQR